LKPETMTMSFLRSTIFRKPLLVEHADVAGLEIAVGGEGAALASGWFQ
jgi:hypothetical protein